MIRKVGTLRRVDLGMGGWLLEDDAGGQWALHGSLPPGLDGARVELYGVLGAEVSFTMTGAPSLIVEQVRVINR
ncbi:MAG: hypothetical protein JXX28_10370 [Deltaproteobacteria bacterium]|nr:hypothetical protein [Deltaproteobacteria bacterium]